MEYFGVFQGLWGLFVLISFRSYAGILSSVLKARDLGQIALIFDVEELSERSRKLDTNVLYLTDRDGFREDPDDDAGVERRVWQVDPLSLTHQLEKFVQRQFGTDPRIWCFERACKLRWKL